MRAVQCYALLPAIAWSLAPPQVLDAKTVAPPQVLDAKTVAQTLWQERDLFETSVHALITRGPPGPPAFRLAYMPCRNRGEILRLMLEEAQVPYELEIVGFRAWRDGGVKATTPHGKLPVLRDYDGRGADLGQEGAITRFLARKLGLAGRTPEEEAAVDALYCFWFATLRNNGVSHDGEHFSCAALKAVEDVGELARPPYGAVFRQNTLSKAERSLVALDFFEKTLADAGTGFLVADAPTVVDLGLFYILYELGEDDICPDWADKFGLPLLRAFADRVAARPQIAAFLASPARMPRYAREPSGASLYTYLAGRDSPDLSL